MFPSHVPISCLGLWCISAFVLIVPSLKPAFRPRLPLLWNIPRVLKCWVIVMCGISGLLASSCIFLAPPFVSLAEQQVQCQPVRGILAQASFLAAIHLMFCVCEDRQGCFAAAGQSPTPLLCGSHSLLDE